MSTCIALTHLSQMLVLTALQVHMQIPADTRTGQLLISATAARSTMSLWRCKFTSMDLSPHPQPNFMFCLDLRMEATSAPSLDTEKSKKILVQDGRNHLKAIKPAQFLYRSPTSPKRVVQYLEPKTLTRIVCKWNLVKSQPPALQLLAIIRRSTVQTSSIAFSVAVRRGPACFTVTVPVVIAHLYLNTTNTTIFSNLSFHIFKSSMQ